MALELRDILYFFMGMAAVCLVISFSAYQLTTYDSVRGIVGQISAQPTEAVKLQHQFDSYNTGQGGPFTYQWGSQSIGMTAAEMAGGQQQSIDKMVDKYATNLYNGNVTGDLTTAHNIAGSGANGFYFLTTLLLAAIFFVILILSYIQQWYETTKDMLKSAGKIILVMGAFAFMVFLLAPPIIESVMWGTINSSEWATEVNAVVEPMISNTFLVNSLIVVLFGALLYGIGFIIHINPGIEDDEGDYERSVPARKAESKPRVKSGGDNESGKPGHKQL